ncbi:MAG: 2OG-Fe(II) oxygenase [Alphaproteobacteria bacterium]|nr:2OG-Fe(II) oxygenase [Alphaproteobacteria bacterium]MCW5741748.1 2OG-Fe(II) oxygenase [Alphaproteobacteria bacterium]
MTERTTPAQRRIRSLDWQAIGHDLDTLGHAVVPGLLDAAECAGLRALYGAESGFRSRVVMARHGFGMGEYRYFARPLPAIVTLLRETFYPPLAGIANRWCRAVGEPDTYPDALAAWLRRCHDAGQTRPTPLLLKYGAGDWNALHRDLYGDLVFPLQMTVLLNRPDEEFDGGDFVLVENRPRLQSRAHVVRLGQGDAVIFAVDRRPVKGSRGWYRTAMRHGVSTITSGERMTLGVIFHDAA